MTEWSYRVPLITFEGLLVQVPNDLRPDLLDRIIEAVHVDVTRRFTDGIGIGKVAVGTQSSEIIVARVSNSLEISGDVPIKLLRGRGHTGRGVHRKGRASWQSRKPVTVDWTYPGNAGDGLFRESVDFVHVRGQIYVRELIAQ